MAAAAACMMMLSACSDIEGLNDYNAVFSFDITDHYGAGGDIEIGEAIVVGNDVYIPVYYGITNFPLYFKGEPQFENPVDRVVGLDAQEWVEIDLVRDSESGEPLTDENGAYMFEEPAFYVQALSGLPREYRFRIGYEATSSDADVFPAVSFAELPEGAVVAGLLTIGEERTALINVVEPQFPLRVVPEFTISDGATLEGNGTTEYVFEDASQRHKFTVVAMDGTREEWSLGLAEMEVVSAATYGVAEEALAFTGLAGFSAEPAGRGFSIEEYAISASAGAGEALPADTLALYVTTYSSDIFPLAVNIEVPLAEGVSLSGDMEGMEFGDMGAVNEFWLLDTAEGLARRWVVTLKEYSSPVASVLDFAYEYSASEVDDGSGTLVSAIVMDDNLSADIDAVNRCIYLRAVDINDFGGEEWRLDLTVDIRVSGGASLVGLDGFAWRGEGSWRTPETFGVKASDGTVDEWRVLIRDWSNGEPDSSDECTIYGVSVREVRPYQVRLASEPVSVDAGARTVTFALDYDDGCYPISFAVDYDLPEFARIATQNGGRDALVFESADSENVVEVVSESGARSERWTFRLAAPVQSSMADVTSFTVLSFSDSGFSADACTVDAGTATVNVNLASTGRYPVTMKFRMGLSEGAASSITDRYGSGEMELSSMAEVPFIVTAEDGTVREWTLRPTYTPQLRNWNFESWLDNSTPLPAGVSGNPYWASANMSAPVVVEGTTRCEGAAGEGYAVQLATKNTLIGRLAAGSLFLGWFDTSNPMGNMNDPVVMMYYGIPFAASGRIAGMQVDISYHPGDGPASDSGTLAIELIDATGLEEVIYHGTRPDGSWHPDNNAVRAARGEAIVATASGQLENGATADLVVQDNVWQTVFVPLEYQGAYPQYTHLTVTFSSSSNGALYEGAVGSVLKVDNVRLVYE